MSSKINFSDAFGFVCNEQRYKTYKNLGEYSKLARTQECAFVYLPIIAQIVGFMRMMGAVCNNTHSASASYRAGTFIRGFVEFTYVLTPLLILIDLVVTAVRAYQMNQADTRKMRNAT